MIAMVSDEVHSEGFPTSQTSGRLRIEREFFFCNRELNDAMVFQNYFSKTPTYELVRFQTGYKMKRDLFAALWMSLLNAFVGLSKTMMD